MSFLKKLFGPKDEPVKTNAEFWDWFSKHAAEFYEILRQRNDIEGKLLQRVMNQLNHLRDGYFILVGMSDGQIAELIITPDGNIKNIVFAEELVASAPRIEGWKFIALKPAMANTDFSVEMGGYMFNASKLNFRYAADSAFPDNIALTMVHDDYQASNKDVIANGTVIFLDNYLGEYQSILSIDDLKFESRTDSADELIPLNKLKDFLIWREKEFVEKYDAVRYTSENNSYGMLKGEVKGSPLVAVVNSDLLKWDAKASHPWMAMVELKYKGHNGMPDEKTSLLMDEINEAIEKDLTEADGYLHIGRQTGQNTREIFMACRDFRRPSNVMDEVKRNFGDRISIDYSIIKDKYWRSMERFRP